METKNPIQIVIEEYYPTLEQLLTKLTELDYKGQNLIVSFPIGNIKIITYPIKLE